MKSDKLRSNIFVALLRYAGVLFSGIVVACVQGQGDPATGAGEHDLRMACVRDVQSLCPEDVDGGGDAAALACLRLQLDSVSPECRDEIAARFQGAGEKPPSQRKDAESEGTEYFYSDGSESPMQTLRFRHADCDGKAPVVIFVHGGAWQVGDKDRAAGYKGDFYAANGYAFATLNYRMLPEVDVAQSAQDIADAMGWIVRNADALGVDPDRIVLQGHSAGAHLAALVSLDLRYLGSAGVNPGAVKVVSLLDGAGYDIKAQIGTGKNAELYRQVFGDNPGDWARLSPITYARERSAQADFVIHHVASRIDSQRQSEGLAEALRSGGVDAIVLAARNKSHATLNREFGLEGDLPTAEVLDFLRDRVEPCHE